VPVNLQCEVHGDTVDGVAAPQSSVVDYILGHGIEVHHSFASDRGQPSTQRLVPWVTFEGILVSTDREVLPQLAVAGERPFYLSKELAIIQDLIHSEIAKFWCEATCDPVELS
jgi:hypothetical protein